MARPPHQSLLKTIQQRKTALGALPITRPAQPHWHRRIASYSLDFCSKAAHLDGCRPGKASQRQLAGERRAIFSCGNVLQEKRGGKTGKRGQGEGKIHPYPALLTTPPLFNEMHRVIVRCARSRPSFYFFSFCSSPQQALWPAAMTRTRKPTAPSKSCR